MRTKGPWSPGEIERFLGESRLPLRLAAHGSSGHPVLAALWFEPRDGLLWCATPRSARIVSLLEADPRCALEVSEQSMPYRGVRGPATAEIHLERGAEVLDGLIERYLGGRSSSLARWLLSRADSEVAIALSPRSWTSWDYGERMADVA